jgi:hypothetical protein
LIQLGIIGCSWGSFVVYICRYRETNRISELFSETNGYVYINLQNSVYINDTLTFLLGLSCFFCLIIFIELFRFNRQIILFIETLKYCGKEVISFCSMFSIIFVAYLCLFYLLFVSKLCPCASVLSTCEMLFQMSVMKYDIHQFMEADAFLGPFCFTLFIFLVVFVCINMFISIVNHSYRRAKENQIEDQLIYSFMINKFLRWLGKYIYLT